MTIEFTPRAAKELNRLDKKLILAFKESLYAFSTRQQCNSRKLKGFPNRYRVRVRDYRAVFDVIIQDDLMLVVRVAHRQDVYEGIERL